MNILNALNPNLEQHGNKGLFSVRKEDLSNFELVDKCFQQIDPITSKVLKVCYVSLYSLYHCQKNSIYEDENDDDTLTLATAAEQNSDLLAMTSIFPETVIHMIWTEFLNLDQYENNDIITDGNKSNKHSFWRQFISSQERERFVLHVTLSYKNNIFFQLAASKELCNSVKKQALHFIQQNLLKIGVLHVQDITKGKNEKPERNVIFDFNHCYNYGLFLLPAADDASVFSHRGHQGPLKIFNEMIAVSCVSASRALGGTSDAEVDYAMKYLPFHLAESLKCDEVMNLLRSRNFFMKRIYLHGIREVSKMHGKDCLNLEFFMNRFQIEGAKGKVLSCWFKIIDYLEKFKEAAEYGDYEYALSYNALKLEGLGWRKEAVFFYEAVLRYQREFTQVTSKDIAFTLNQLGRIHAELSSYADSVRYYDEAMYYEKEIYGEYDKVVAETCEKIAKINVLSGNYNGAYAYYEDLAEIKVNIFGHDTLEVAQVKRDIGHLHVSVQNYKEALVNYQEALEIAKVLEINSLISTLNFTVGGLYSKIGEHMNAIKFYEESLDFYEQHDRNNHKEVATVFEAKGDACVEVKDLKQAVTCYKNVLGLFKAYLHNESKTKILHKLAHVLKANGKFKDAINIYKEILPTMKSDMDDESVCVIMFGMADCYEENTDFPKAFECYSKVFDFTAADETRMKVALKLKQLGDTCILHKSVNLAMRCFVKAKAALVRIVGPDHVDIADIQHRLGTIFIKKGMYAKAETYLLDGLRIRKLNLGNEHETVADILHDMGIVKQMEKKYPDSLNRFLEALAIRKKRFGELHIKVAETMHIIGVLMMKTEKYMSATQIFGDALEIYRKTGLSDTHHNVLDVLKCTEFLTQKLEQRRLSQTISPADSTQVLKNLEKLKAYTGSGTIKPNTITRDTGTISQAA